MTLNCLFSYLFVAMIISVLIWPALIVAKRDDITRGLDLIEDTAPYKTENQ